MPVTVYLEKRASKRTEENAIRVQVSVKGVTLQSTIGYTIDPDHWDGEKVKPKSASKGSPSLQVHFNGLI